MTERDDREQQKAELLWKYIEELKQAENPDEVQFVAVTHGECAEVVGLMETAAEACVLLRSESAPHCRREAVWRRLQATIAAAAPSRPATLPSPTPRSIALPGWLTAPLTGRSTGWVVAAAALLALLWMAVPRTPPDAGDRAAPVVPMSHTAAVAAIPQFIDGTLDPEKSRALWAHIIRCDGCMELYLKLRAARSAAGAARQSALPPEKAPDVRRQSPGARQGGMISLRVAAASWGRSGVGIAAGQP